VRLRRFQALFIAAVAATAVATPVLACGDGWMGVNLVVTPQVKASLRSAYLDAHPGLSPSRVSGPVSGRTYYGSYSGTYYALATFSAGTAPAYPTIFRTDTRGRWHVRQQTRGGVCTNVVPTDLIMVWWLEHAKGRCFVEPLL
jgi:hypothetical protein